MRNTHTQSRRYTTGSVDQVIKNSILLAYDNYRDRKFDDACTILDAVFFTNKLDITITRQLDMLKRLVDDTIKVDSREEYMKDSFKQFVDIQAKDHLKWRHTQPDVIVDNLGSDFHSVASLVPMLERLHARLSALESNTA